MADPSQVTDKFRMVVMQHETLCNLDCSYCYLPGRKTSNRVSVDIARSVADDIAHQATLPDAPPQVAVLWHCSEPLATPERHFRTLLEPFEELRRAGIVQHTTQTNATIVDDAWCRFLTDYGFEVGVSLDGPADLNRHRVDWAGEPAYERILRGLRRLQDAGLDPHVICVVPPESTSHGTRLMEFFRSLGINNVAFNIEEREASIGAVREPVTYPQARRFWADIIADTQRHPGIRLRDLGILAGWLTGKPSPFRDPLPTVTWDGNVVLLSPEFVGLRAPDYGDFIAGNLRTETLRSILDRQHGINYVADFERGLAACRDHCIFWSACHGSYAIGRWIEHRRLDVMETEHCRNTRQAPVLALLDTARAHGDQSLTTQLSPFDSEEIPA